MTEQTRETARAIEQLGIHRIEPGQIVAVANHKGGEGKTITATEVAVTLADRGARVRVIDGDGQGASTTFVLRPQWDHVDPRERYELADVLAGEATLDQATWPTMIPGVDLVPSSSAVQGFGKGPAEMGLEWRLHEAFAASERPYDVQLQDCPPSLELLALALLVAADKVVIPLKAGGLDYEGLLELNQTLATVRGPRLRPDQVTAAILLTVRENNTLTTVMLEQLLQDYPEALVGSVRKTVRVGEATVDRENRMPVSRFAPTATAVIDYQEITEILFAPVLERAAS